MEREWNKGGFRFKGIHSSEYGVHETPNSTQLMPSKRRTLITIPGRSAAFLQEDGGYDTNKIAITCSYVPRQGEDLQRQVRRIAHWLSGVGELSFDFESEMFYQAYVSSSPSIVKNMAIGAAQFTIEFTLFEPFAYERTQAVSNKNLALNTWMPVRVDGTTTTPARIKIRNDGTNTWNSVSITIRNTSDESNM